MYYIEHVSFPGTEVPTEKGFDEEPGMKAGIQGSHTLRVRNKNLSFSFISFPMPRLFSFLFFSSSLSISFLSVHSPRPLPLPPPRVLVFGRVPSCLQTEHIASCLLGKHSASYRVAPQLLFCVFVAGILFLRQSGNSGWPGMSMYFRLASKSQRAVLCLLKAD